MNKLTPLALVTVAAFALAACDGDNNKAAANDGFVAEVRALLNDMSEAMEPMQALFDRLIATTPETTEPEPL